MVFPKIHYANFISYMPLVVTKFNLLFWKSQNDFLKPYDCSSLTHLCFKAEDQQTLAHFPPAFTSKILSAHSSADVSIIYGSFHATTAELSSYDKDCGLRNLKYLLSTPPITENVCQPPTWKKTGWSLKS